MTAFVDTSIFQGVREFKNTYGQEFMAKLGCGSGWSVYEKRGDAFIHAGRSFAKKTASCKQVYDDYLNDDC
jgi:hypothetical protein